MSLFAILIVIALIFAVISLIPNVAPGVPWLAASVILICIAILVDTLKIGT
jgi:hypothetical protein